MTEFEQPAFCAYGEWEKVRGLLQTIADYVTGRYPAGRCSWDRGTGCRRKTAVWGCVLPGSQSILAGDVLGEADSRVSGDNRGRAYSGERAMAYKVPAERCSYRTNGGKVVRRRCPTDGGKV